MTKYNKNILSSKKLGYASCRPNNSTQSLASSSKCSSVERLYCKCCHNLTIKNKGFEVSKLTYTNNLVEDVKTDDELLLILDSPAQQNLNASNETLKADSGNASGHSFSFHEIDDEFGESIRVDGTPIAEKKTVLRSNSYRSSWQDPITATPKRNVRSRRAYDILRQHSLNKKLFESLNHLNLSDLPATNQPTRPRSDQFDSIRFEIMMKMTEMKQLLIREEMLLTQIQLKCAHYKAENEAYNSRLRLDLHVDEIQKNLEECATEIIQNEQELFKTKIEVERKAKVLQDLKGLLDIHDSDEEQVKEMVRFKLRTKKQIERVRHRMSLDELNFVDDIYEFCDGNKSLIV